MRAIEKTHDGSNSVEGVCQEGIWLERSAFGECYGPLGIQPILWLPRQSLSSLRERRSGDAPTPTSERGRGVSRQYTGDWKRRGPNRNTSWGQPTFPLRMTVTPVCRTRGGRFDV